MTVAQLLERFTAIGIEQDQAILRDQHAKFNRLFDEMVAIEDELKAREGDQRRELLSLYTHPNAQVRLNAMKATLAVAPEIARRALLALAESREYPQAADAGMSLLNLERGIFQADLDSQVAMKRVKLPDWSGRSGLGTLNSVNLVPATFQAPRALSAKAVVTLGGCKGDQRDHGCTGAPVASIYNERCF